MPQRGSGGGHTITDKQKSDIIKGYQALVTKQSDGMIKAKLMTAAEVAEFLANEAERLQPE